MLDNFSSVETSLNVSEENAIHVAEIVSGISSEDYKQLVKEVDAFIQSESEPNV